jgi:hypothetical protein
MKKILISIITFCISLITYSQEGRGLDNKFYFRLGYSQPATSYLGGDKDAWENVKRVGGSLELGSIFMLNNLDLGDGVRLGINVDYVEINYHQFDYNDFIELFILRVGQVSSKVGPSISYNPVSKLIFDAYIKAKIPWVGGAYVEADDPDWNERNYLGTMGFGFSTGLNIRFSVLIIGFEFASNNLKLENRDESGDYLGNLLDNNDSGDKTKIACFNFTLGLNF